MKTPTPQGQVELLRPHRKSALLVLQMVIYQMPAGPVREASFRAIRYALEEYEEWKKHRLPPLPNHARPEPRLKNETSN